MAENGELWQGLVDAIDAHVPVALLVVTDSVGSSPGKIGAKMVVTAEASIGTIGGGSVESGLLKSARTMLNNADTTPRIFRRAHHPTNGVQSSGMICGGEQTVLIYPCQSENRVLLVQLRDSCRLRTPLSLCISAQGLQVLPSLRSALSPEFKSGENWHYQETVGVCNRAYIIGAGHVGLAFSRVLDMLDFDITVIDDREELDSMRANAYARQKWRLEYSEIAKHIPEGPDVFVFIMTHNHHADELVLTKLAGKQFAYLGLLGSQNKIACLKDSLVQKLPRDQLHRLHAPMGLPINSHTPAEIAISIAAELIQLLNANPQ